MGFQVFVLYPWHKELNDGFDELRREHIKNLQEGQGELRAIRKELEALRAYTEVSSTRR